jgi:hypothetical protein
MAHAHAPQQRFRYLSDGMAIFAVLFLFASSARVQNTTGGQAAEAPLTQEMSKYPGLPDEFVQLLGQLQQNVHFPAPRTESRLLPLLPAWTIAYMAIPNYGESLLKV